MPSRNKLSCLRVNPGRMRHGLCLLRHGSRGARRASLTAAEIYEQVMHVRDDFGERVTSVGLEWDRASPS